MNLNEAIRKRRSVRKYKSGIIIPDEHIRTILESAMMAPSARNTRPWEFVVLKSDEAKQKAIDIHPYAGHLKKASIGIVICARPDLQEGIAEGFFPQDCGAAVENILLSSLELGYGSCWCGIYPREDRVEMFREAFNLSNTPMALIVIGKADEEPNSKGFYEESKVTII